MYHSFRKGFRKGFRNALAVLLATSFIACASDDDPDGPINPDDLTYYRDVKPIIDAKCVQCHYDGGIAPFSLETYDDVLVHAGVSKLAIEAGTMPPWHASDDCGEYVGNRSLIDEHRDILLAWMGGDGKAGNPDEVGDPIEVERTTIERVDLELAMPEQYTPQTSGDYREDYRCFLIEWPGNTTQYITGFRAVPGNDSIVHHVIAFVATPSQAGDYPALDAADPGPGYECFGGTGGPANSWVGSWAPGSQGNSYPAGVGLEMQPGSLIVMQVHYNTLAVGAGEVPADQTKLQFTLADQVDKVGFIMPWANPAWLSGTTMHIPPNQDDVMHSFAYDPTLFLGTQSLAIHGGGLHMHLLGKQGSLAINRGGGGQDCIVEVDEYDFNWQDGYTTREPKILNRGDQLYLECHWDNSPENQPVVDGEQMPPSDVYWGEASTDEMCLGVLLVVPDP